jgi:methionine biosynthesis protein MetW
MSAVDVDLRRRRAWAYENPRPEVQALVPRGAVRILDVGCSTGALGAALKQRQQAEVVGIETDPVYAREAERRLDRVITADVEQLVRGQLELGSFDCLIAADVLEHLRDPWATLAGLATTLRPGGTAVISVPNVRFWETFWVLGRHGVWPVREAGTFDRDHLRWFTRFDAEQLMVQAGLTVTGVRAQYRLRPERSEITWLVRWLSHTKLGSFLAFQYVIAGLKPPSASEPTPAP